MRRVQLCLFVITVIISAEYSSSAKHDVKKKDIRDYTEGDLEKLYEQWEENDEDQLEEDELPPYKRKTPQPDLDMIMKQAKTPEDLMMMSKKGQSVMMFVGIADVDGRRAEKLYTERWIGLWQNSLFNNHIDVKTYTIDDNRAIFMFSDGSKAWEAKDFLLKQPQVSEVLLEGQKFPGLISKNTGKLEL